MRWLWAAYRMKAFGGIPDSLTPDEFDSVVMQSVGSVLQAKGDVFVLLTRAERPVGVVQMTPGQGQMWPHCTWFPWATARNKIECALQFFNQLKERHNLVIPSLPETVDFFSHFCRYGVLRRIGTGRGWLGETDVALFETVRRYAERPGLRRIEPGRE